MPHDMSISYWTALQQLVDGSEIVVDRPKGSSHPRFVEIVYPLDYGYLQGTKGGDGDGVDVWLGSGAPLVTGVIVTVDLNKRDAEQKILLGCTVEEMQMLERFHAVNQQSAMLIVRVA